MATCVLDEGPLPNTCIIKGLTVKVAGPTKTPYILNAEQCEGVLIPFLSEMLSCVM